MVITIIMKRNYVCWCLKCTYYSFIFIWYIILFYFIFILINFFFSKLCVMLVILCIQVTPPIKSFINILHKSTIYIIWLSSIFFFKKKDITLQCFTDLKLRCMPCTSMHGRKPSNHICADENFSSSTRMDVEWIYAI